MLNEAPRYDKRNMEENFQILCSSHQFKMYEQIAALLIHKISLPLQYMKTSSPLIFS